MQVATPDLVVLELPRARRSGRISNGLRRVLADTTVTKVFCDSAAHRDVNSLGLSKESPGIVNLEQVAIETFGKTSAARGLAKIAGLVCGARVEKGDAANYKEFEDAAGAKLLSDSSDKALRHAALEAHTCLLTWRALVARASEERPAPEVITAPPKKKAVDEDSDEDLQDIDDEIKVLERKLRALDGARPAAAAAAAAPEPARAARDRKFTGWKRALDEELRAAGGALPWKRVRDALVAKRRSCRGGHELSDDLLGLKALACIPDEYLSRADDLVRLQEAPEQVKKRRKK